MKHRNRVRLRNRLVLLFGSVLAAKYVLPRALLGRARTSPRRTDDDAQRELPPGLLRALEQRVSNNGTPSPRGGTYRSSPSERYVLDHAAELGLDATRPSDLKPTCRLWGGAQSNGGRETTSSQASSPIAADLARYREELRRYRSALLNFTAVGDLRGDLRAVEAAVAAAAAGGGGGKSEKAMTREDVCRKVDLNLDGIFASGQLSSSSGGGGGAVGGDEGGGGGGGGRGKGGFGKIEPLLPPLRHPEFCFDPFRITEEEHVGAPEGLAKYMLDLGYLVHDFRALCDQLLSHSRIVLVDMGASLSFHGGESGEGGGEEEESSIRPAVYLTELYRRFGFPFDHIYAFEVTPTDPNRVFDSVPEELLPAYHWINVGVNPDPESKLNPLRMILDAYDEDDVVIIKLDVDTPFVELPLVTQLLIDDRYVGIVDHFYFEHHVLMDEMSLNGWGTDERNVRGSVRQSLELFRELRRRGIASHYWP